MVSTKASEQCMSVKIKQNIVLLAFVMLFVDVERENVDSGQTMILIGKMCIGVQGNCAVSARI